VRAEFFVRAQISSLVEEIQLFVGENATAAVKPVCRPVGGDVVIEIVWHDFVAHGALKTQPNTIGTYSALEEIQKCLSRRAGRRRYLRQKQKSARDRGIRKKDTTTRNSASSLN
jgi:hypothetical protein